MNHVEDKPSVKNDALKAVVETNPAVSVMMPGSCRFSASRNLSTCCEVEPATLGTESQRQTNYAAQLT
ncbi:hypothetical protein TNCV_4508351 [Trichonephila clavipes]|nr:hypothetical protein TNCV_4508351 [Trichonephila clavipes]